MMIDLQTVNDVTTQPVAVSPHASVQDLGGSCEEQLSHIPSVSFKGHAVSPKRLTDLPEVRSGKENFESQPQGSTSLTTKQHAAKTPFAPSPSSKPLRSPRPVGIQGVLNRCEQAPINTNGRLVRPI